MPPENKKGEAFSLALKLNNNSVRRRRDDVDTAAVLVELDRAVFQREQSPIAADADIDTREKFAAALTDENAASGDNRAAKFFDTETFAVAVASVLYAALTFFMCHNELRVFS